MSNEVDWSKFAGPADYRPSEVEPALRAIGEVTDEDSMWRAYHRLLFAVGNSHAGELYSAALVALPRVAGFLQSDRAWVRRAAGEILTELVAFHFHPDFAPAAEEASYEAKLALLLPHAESLALARDRAGDDGKARVVFEELLEDLRGLAVGS